MKTSEADVIIVGAGPGGSSAAYFLAKEGFKTLLIDKSGFPRDKTCGDGVTRMSARLIRQLGILPKLSGYSSIKGVRVAIQGKGSRDFYYPDELEEPKYGFVVPRYELDNLLCKNAVEAGAIFIEKTAADQLLYSSSGAIEGVLLHTGVQLRSRVVIAADGAASRLAYQAGLPQTPKEALGFGIRGYYKGIKELTELLEIYMPVVDTTGNHVLPSYGWIFPLDNGRANIGIGLSTKRPGENVQKIMGRFVEKLKATGPRFAEMQLEGRWSGAPMRFDFSPDTCYAPGLLLVGDAAGMISPFTGEGIGYAIETGRLAAEVIKKRASLPGGFTDLSLYGKKLASKFQGYFEAGTEAGKKFHFLWKVLNSTFENEKPLFQTIRQATLFPEGVGESFFKYYTEDVSEHIFYKKTEIRTDLLTIGQELIDLTRKDWPFLSRLFTAKQITPGIPFRPALFILLSGYDGKPRREELVRLGTALELGYASAMCHNSIENKDNTCSGNWGNMLSILVGDFLLAEAYKEMTALDSAYCLEIAKSLCITQEAHVKGVFCDPEKITVKEYIEWLSAKNQSLFELCLFLGSLLGNGGMQKSLALKEFGKYFGVAYQVIDETLSELNRGKNLNRFTGVIYNEAGELLSLPKLLAIQKKIGNLHGQSLDGVFEDCLAVAESHLQKAVQCLAPLNDSPLKQSLAALSGALVAKARTLVLRPGSVEKPVVIF